MYDKDGVQVVSYFYDSWGKLISIDGTMKDSVGIKNPYRYRGYRYDTETGLYYLQSRYYNPEWGRFINADGIIGETGELLGHNLFVYCKNNPINGRDTFGLKTAFADEETQRQYDQWLRTQASTVVPNKNEKSVRLSKNQIDNLLVGNIGGLGDKVLEKAANKLPSHVPYYANRAYAKVGRSE
ncbi:tRNA nuclease WapA precursor [Clostridium homopropionicum DSM 5847]|uniref:tRNA nuclease WapA n=1 Tax=Clostridium homopropionicum DSM 5847 TaxID=1121318 RepID=A0A0L6ZDH6_9CLOT|nr:RHS repeat-associated core domain-containing protein [Clostridium homopropionicum]KOA20843.1 tRNA nuclease WapA precursor [Clostridium homopropionicum DSM 5847]SFF87692.1 RHS repeat-associated core domain-containing protein [Clostridium homopropionicum]